MFRKLALLLSLACFCNFAYAEDSAKPATSSKVPTKAKGKKTQAKKGAKKETNWPSRRPKREIAPMPALGAAPFPEGERLAYEIKMFNTVAGQATLAVGSRTNVGGKDLVPFAATIQSSDFLNKFYTINDKMIVNADTRTFLPHDSSFYIRENKISSDDKATFDQVKKVVSSKRVRDKKTFDRSFKTAPNVFDPLTAVYAIRRMDLEPGMKFEFYIWDSRRERLVTAKVGKKEKVWIPQGYVEALRIDVSAQVTGGFIREKQLEESPDRGTAWISTDEHRVPVKLTTPTKLGEAEVYLTRRWVEENNAVDTSMPR